MPCLNMLHPYCHSSFGVSIIPPTISPTPMTLWANPRFTSAINIERSSFLTRTMVPNPF